MPIPLTCERCHQIFRVRPSDAHRRFCSRVCSDLFIRGVHGHRYAGGKATFSCTQCGKEFADWVSQRGPSRGLKTFCSHACYGESLKGHVPHNKGAFVRVEKNCLHCGALFSAQPAVSALRKFCSPPCSAAFNSGPRHPHFRGGHTMFRQTLKRRAYDKWRMRVLIRDGGRCRWCDSEGKRTYRELEVHHIVPVSTFPDGALVETNAITLCIPHHDSINGREHEYAQFFADLLQVPLGAPAQPNRKDRVPLSATAEQLRAYYWDMKLNTEAIGKLFNVTGACVLKYMKKYHIARRPAHPIKREAA